MKDLINDTAVLMSKDHYIINALGQIPRMLGYLDRRKESPTYGSFDRNYWQYRAIDFSGASYQMLGLSLALIFKNKYPGNQYYQNEIMAEWSIASLHYLSRIQNYNGGFNHFYPYITSMAVVAFPVYAATEAYISLEEIIDPARKSELLKMFKKAGNWLMGNSDLEVTNQEAGGAVALLNIARILSDTKYEKTAFDKIDRILSKQDQEGWIYEYKGGDIGYSTVCLDYLAKFYQKTNSQDVKHAIDKLLGYLKYFIHPNHTAGGEYASRNNEFIIPSGFEIMAPASSIARSIADSNLKGLSSGELLNSSDFDQVYLALNHPTFLQAFDAFDREESYDTYTILPACSSFEKFFRNAGMYAMANDKFYLVMGCSKGGVIRLYDKQNGGLVFSDPGYTGYDSKKVISSQHMDPERIINHSNSNPKINVGGDFCKVNYTYMSVSKFILFRAFMLMISRFPFVHTMVYKFLRKTAITGSKTVKVSFKRQLFISDDEIIIDDEIKNPKKVLDKLFSNDFHTSMYGQSKDFFQPQNAHTLLSNRDIQLEKLSDTGSIKIKKSLMFRNNSWGKQLKIIAGNESR